MSASGVLSFFPSSAPAFFAPYLPATAVGAAGVDAAAGGATGALLPLVVASLVVPLHII